MRYAIARYQSQRRDLAYRIYVTDCLRIATENTAKTTYILANGKAEVHIMQIRFADILENKPVDNRTANDIIEGIRKKMK